jgi:hypothetical protein
VQLAAIVCATALGMVSLPSAVGATPIGPSCGTCQGSSYELSYSGSPISTTATTETYRITYTIDTSGYDGPGVYLDTVAFKVANALVSADLIAAPGGVPSWTEMHGGLSAAGCSGTGSGYDCVRFATQLTNAPAVPGGIYMWIFDVEVSSGTLFTGLDEASVKARYVGSGGAKKGDLVSENISLTNVPEPGTALLLVFSSLALRRHARRR